MLRQKPPKASLNQFKKQLKYYCQEKQVELGVLTNGLEWQVYYFGTVAGETLPIKTIKLRDDEVKVSEEALRQLLSRNSLLDKSAATLAEKLWNRCMLSSAWESLLARADNELVRCLVRETKKHKVKVSRDEVAKFVKERAKWANSRNKETLEIPTTDQSGKRKDITVPQVQRKKPSSVQVKMFGVESEFESYRAVMINFVLQACDQKKVELGDLEQLLASDGRMLIMVYSSEKPSSLSAPKRIGETNYWLEVHFSSKSIKRQCKRIRQALSLPENVLIWWD